MNDASPLRGKRVLITRPAQQAEELAQALRTAGAEPIVAPAIEIGPPDDPAALRASVARARTYDWVVFTSRNGVEALFTAARAREPLDRSASPFGDARVAAIGPKTADALALRGVRVDLIPPSFVGEAVAAELLARTQSSARVLLYRAQDGRETIPETLRAHGRVVDVVAAYATTPVRDPSLREKAARADVVTFASASAVDGFARNVPDPGRLLRTKTVAAIGPVTAKAARAAGIRVDAVAAEFTVDGLLDALAAAASS
ncbi:MAG TPA: uroporphyrinogen-III synthase [Candidatus Baltobacteraceae bacterium]|nr:uroporphyrinogen-III synthase [Candidatus Baltobacteraceae bacterium]